MRVPEGSAAVEDRVADEDEIEEATELAVEDAIVLVVLG
jgi:hypothetical protein